MTFALKNEHRNEKAIIAHKNYSSLSLLKYDNYNNKNLTDYVSGNDNNFSLTTTATVGVLITSSRSSPAIFLSHIPIYGLSTWLLILIMGILSVLTILGNLVVLLSYYLDKNIRQPSNYFIFSLAVSDLVSFFLEIEIYIRLKF